MLMLLFFKKECLLFAKTVCICKKLFCPFVELLGGIFDL